MGRERLQVNYRIVLKEKREVKHAQLNDGKIYHHHTTPEGKKESTTSRQKQRKIIKGAIEQILRKTGEKRILHKEKLIASPIELK